MTDYKPGGEVRITSATGGEKGQKDVRLGGSDPLALLELGRVYGYGEQKYARYNYLKGYAWSLSVDALLRHLMAFLSGEERDPETGLLHTAHLSWHGLALTSFQLRGIGTDDRAPEPEAEQEKKVAAIVKAAQEGTISVPEAMEAVGFDGALCDEVKGCILPKGHAR